jgi:hypothetical protein
LQKIGTATIAVMMLFCITAECISARPDDEKQIKLEDIERDTLLHETDRSDDANVQKELAPEPTQHIQLSYSNDPQDVFVTPTPGRYSVKGMWKKINHNLLLPPNSTLRRKEK